MSNPTNFLELLTAPVEPPQVFLTSQSSDVLRQRGILIHADWTVEGEWVKIHPGPPGEPPVPLDASESDIVIVRIAIESAPAFIQVRQFGRIDLDGTYDGEPVATDGWSNPRLFSSDGDNARRLRYNSDASPPGWELEMWLSGDSIVTYMNVWVHWYALGTQRQGDNTYSANWRVSARR